jgi:hypothetical protein
MLLKGGLDTLIGLGNKRRYFGVNQFPCDINTRTLWSQHKISTLGADEARRDRRQGAPGGVGARVSNNRMVMPLMFASSVT